MPFKKIAVKRPLPPTFATAQAETKFREEVLKKLCCPEKGFVFQPLATLGYPEFIHSIVTRNGWMTLCNHQASVSVQVVREFYAHLLEMGQEAVYVRGVQVPCDSIAINRALGTPHERDEHEAFADSIGDTDFERIMSDLCVAGAAVSRSRQGALSFRRNDLKPQVKVWYHFLKASLMPTGHLHSVSKERALLLHSIVQGCRIDIGRILHAEICTHALKPGGRLYFPCLINRLCVQANVHIDEDEEQMHNAGAITTGAIHRIAQEEPGPSSAAAAGTSTDLPHTTEAGPSAAPADTDPSSIEQRLSTIEATQTTIIAGLQQLNEDQRTYWSYRQRWDRALQQNLQANSKRFFNFPMFPADILHPPEDRD